MFLGLEQQQANEIARYLDLIADRMSRLSTGAVAQLGTVAWHGPDHQNVETDVRAFAAEMRKAAERMAARAALVRSTVDRQQKASRQ
ncbi:MAG TPA: hypothetical protein VFC00_20685 [Micromonosporaceae bacterium]|nr:hypothetical protein [Micromonosporaceae bacterium]